MKYITINNVYILIFIFIFLYTSKEFFFYIKINYIYLIEIEEQLKFFMKELIFIDNFLKLI